MNTQRWCLCGLLLVAAALRICDLPRGGQLKHVDEITYLTGSLSLLEGMTPTMKYSPAGPQTWAGWLLAGGESAMHLLRPGPEERAIDVHVRPFAAVNHAIFDSLRDLSTLRWIWVLMALAGALGAVFMAFRLGVYWAGTPGGLLAGGLIALMPIFVQLCGEARPYALGWELGAIAVAAAILHRDRRGQTFAAVMFGLAVGTRVDMLALLPVAWSVLWSRRRETPGEFMRAFWRFNLSAAAVSVLVAPWLLTTLVGNLRIIATVRLSTPPGGPVPFTQTLRDLVWGQGLAVAMLLAAAGLAVPWPGERRPRWLLSLFGAFLLVSMFKATAFGLQHQGPALVLLALLSPLALRLVGRWSPSLPWVVAVIALALPAGRSVAGVYERYREFAPDGSVAWIEQHVTAGTRVYTSVGIVNLLPTVASSDRTWREVNDDPAWVRKVQAGMERFHISAADLPRALSEEHMVGERAAPRMEFILGGRPSLPTPRYDIRLSLNSPIFGEQDPVSAFKRTGGVFLYRGNRRYLTAAGLGPPTAEWAGPDGDGTFVYYSPAGKD